MERGNTLAGIVVLPDGHPVAGADLALCTETQGAEIGARHIKGIYETNITTTGSDGSFIFPALEGRHTIYAAHEQGFAELDITETASPYRITLQPWGAIEGTAMLAGKPLAGVEMALQGPLPNPVSAGVAISPADYTTKTDEQGKFIFTNLPPLELRLGRMINGFFHGAQYVTIKPGAPTVLQYGGGGAVVSARLQVPGYTHQIHWKAGQSIVLTADVTEPDKPAFDDEAGEKLWIGQFWKSEEGKAWQHSQRAFTTTAEDDGSFKIEDLPPGKYRLRVQLREAAEFGGQRLAALETNLTIAEPSTPSAPQNLDLGLVSVPPAANLRPGDMAPLFATKTIFGRPLKLADFRGKFVLLDFWATWCGPCVAEIPNLKAVYDKFSKDPRFAMLSLSLDAQPAQPIEFIHENDIRWTQGFLGTWSESPIPDLYGVDGIPAMFLIGPDGKIVARDLRGPGVAEAIAKAMGAD
jgi:thiol-disulfide isomerase/thioredoxin